MFEKDKPEFTTRVWIEDAFCGDVTFKGYSTDSKVMKIPMNFLSSVEKKQTKDKDQDTKELIIQKEGPGRLYYRLAMNYAPEELSIDAVCNGFEVIRTYQAGEPDVSVKKDSDGLWHFPKGKLIRVVIGIRTKYNRYNVAIVDKLVMEYMILMVTISAASRIRGRKYSTENGTANSN